MSDTTTTTCDLCGEQVDRTAVHYAVVRNDQFGYFDTLDVCSAECLAHLAVGEGHERGERNEASTGPRNAPKPEPSKSPKTGARYVVVYEIGECA